VRNPDLPEDVARVDVAVAPTGVLLAIEPSPAGVVAGEVLVVHPADHLEGSAVGDPHLHVRQRGRGVAHGHGRAPVVADVHAAVAGIRGGEVRDDRTYQHGERRQGDNELAQTRHGLQLVEAPVLHRYLPMCYSTLVALNELNIRRDFGLSMGYTLPVVWPAIKSLATILYTSSV
jgi:hypothetical protein